MRPLFSAVVEIRNKQIRAVAAGAVRTVGEKELGARHGNCEEEDEEASGVDELPHARRHEASTH